ncbi:hypothetical protein THAOC_35206 [Thalassiosira oceanica]|uniref:Uncharacterized protein n=1 Tax=Thalassiosira oceanica TaxID=159749 RepID=K0RHQ2_THAOC|nr:hypothetical protein THAOC_35206 [Thalassiosira oceanica]|eukprot:EJK46142.1 hypothetical protein THAOC_35206 [Thalassiosira oceanica]
MENDGMECYHGAAKRQRVSTVEPSALTRLANIDVLSHLATFLEAGELCQVRATCKALGSSDESAFDGLSMAEEAARRIFESASDEEKAMLPRHDNEGWIELYHHLLMLRARLTFDQLLGRFVEYQAGDKAAVQGTSDFGTSSAICGNHVMRAGKHWATFISGREDSAYQSVGVIRPLPGWDQRRLVDLLTLRGPYVQRDQFHPANPIFWEDLRRERTSRWEGDVHFCHLYLSGNCNCNYSDLEGVRNQISDWQGFDNFDRDIDTLGMLLDLDSGRLSVYQNGQRVGILKDGLAGVYCWFTSIGGIGGSTSIMRGYDVVDA